MQATSKLRSPLPSPDRPLLRMRGRYLSVDAAMPTMNIQYFFRYSRCQMCVNLQQIRSERDIVCPVKCREVTVKKKRVETFRKIRYGDVHYTDSAAAVGPPVGLAQARPN